jgi:hypothetical protein
MAADGERWHVLSPFDRREVLTLTEAARHAGKTPRTISNWCEGEGLGRKIGGTWHVSKVALQMFLDGDTRSLRQYLAGDRESETVRIYFTTLGVPIGKNRKA